MQINSQYSVLAARAYRNDAGRDTVSAAMGAPLAANISASEKNADSVVLSDAAKRMLTLSAEAPERTITQQKVLDALRDDPKAASETAYSMAYTPSRIFYAIQKNGDVRLASNGRSADDSYRASFEKEAAAVDAQLREIYDREKAKGADPLDIIAELMDFKNKQSASYREATAWGYK